MQSSNRRLVKRRGVAVRDTADRSHKVLDWLNRLSRDRWMQDSDERKVHDLHDPLATSTPFRRTTSPSFSTFMSSLDVDRSALYSPSSRKRTSFPPVSLSLSHEHIQDALSRSPDDGATLVFMKLNLTYIGEAAADRLANIGKDSPDDESRVERCVAFYLHPKCNLKLCFCRIALGHNRLSALPTDFALLSRLRYLNLKHNSFTVFPNVVRMLVLYT